MQTPRTRYLMLSLVLGLLMVLTTILTVQADPARHPYKWPDGKDLKICFEGDFWDVKARKENVRKALDEWLNPDDHPAAGEKLTGGTDEGETNPNNDTADEMMEEGDHWDLDDFRWPKVNRSFSKGEKEAMKDAHKNLPTWSEVEDCSDADIVFKSKDLGKGHLGSTKTSFYPDEKVKSEVTVDSDPDQGDGENWHHASDGDGDGKITNNDANYETGVIGTGIDFYSVVKHEIGHAVSFGHAHGDDLRARDLEQRPEYGETGGADPDQRTQEINPPPDAVPPTDSDVQQPGSLGDEQLAGHATRLYFASDFVGYPSGPGAGGMDVWMADWDFATSTWISVTNAGPGVNSPADEMAPYVGEDGAYMVFARGDRMVPMTFDLFQSRWDITNTLWLSATSLPLAGFDTSADELAPALSPDGRTLFFASNVSGTFDLWQSELDVASGTWLTPTRLPAPVNSPLEHEIDPMLTDEGRLYFSSNRTGGAGLFDLWWSEMTAGGWLTPTNVSGANTFCEEGRPFETKDGDALYYTSNLSGTIFSGFMCDPLNYDVKIIDNQAPVLRVFDALDPVAPGHVETYTLVYEDTRPTFDLVPPVAGLVISATYPDYTRFMTASPAPDPGTDNAWTVGDLMAGQRGSISVTLWVSDTASEAPAETTPGLRHLGVLELDVSAAYTNPLGVPMETQQVHDTWVLKPEQQIYLPIIVKDS